MHYFLEELGPFAWQMTHTAKTVIVVNINNQVGMEVKFKNIGNTPSPDVHSGENSSDVQDCTLNH